MTFGPPLINAIKTPMFKDVHLLIQDPLEKTAEYVAAGADLITVHAESGQHVHRVLQTLGTMTNVNDPDRGLIRGIALNPGTPIETLVPLLDEIEMVVLLAINPGWDGQKFIPSTQNRITWVKNLIKETNKDILICVDAGINRKNITEIARMGADILVTGSAVFDGKTPLENARFMLTAVK
jgi:ribulose-phosphate 3-epimerase